MILALIFLVITAVSSVESSAHRQDDEPCPVTEVKRFNHQGTETSDSQDRTLTVQEEPHKKEKRGASYSAEDYEYNYDYEYEDSAEEDEKTFLERMDTKLTKKYIITAAILFNVFVGVTCICCLCCCTCCKEVCRALRRTALESCDRMCGRDAKYRKVKESFKRMDLEPPTYEEFKVLRDSAGLDKDTIW